MPNESAAPLPNNTVEFDADKCNDHETSNFQSESTVESMETCSDELSYEEPTSKENSSNTVSKCIFCLSHWKKSNHRYIIPSITDDYKTFNIIIKYAEDFNDEGLLYRIDLCMTERDLIFYHPICKSNYVSKGAISSRPKTNWHKKRSIYDVAFTGLCAYIKYNVIEKKNCCYISFVEELFLDLVDCQQSCDINSNNIFFTKHIASRLENFFKKEIKIITVNDRSIVAPRGKTITLVEEQKINDEDLLNRAALLLRKKILQSPPTKLEGKIYSQDLLKGEIDIPESLIHFYKSLIGGFNYKRRKSEKTTRIANSFAADMIHIVTNGQVKPSKHIALGMALKSLTNKRKIIDVLHRYGHICSYHVLEELETEAAYTLYEYDKVSTKDMKRKPNLRTGVAWDNFDRFYETTTGKVTMNDTVGIAYQDEITDESDGESDTDENLISFDPDNLLSNENQSLEPFNLNNSTPNEETLCEDLNLLSNENQSLEPCNLNHSTSNEENLCDDQNLIPSNTNNSTSNEENSMNDFNLIPEDVENSMINDENFIEDLNMISSDADNIMLMEEDLRNDFNMSSPDADNTILKENNFDENQKKVTLKRKRQLKCMPKDLPDYTKTPRITETFLPWNVISNLDNPSNLEEYECIDKAWVVSHFLKIKTPMWVGFNAILITDKSKKQKIFYLQPINASPTQKNVVLLTMQRALAVAEECGEKYALVAYDLAIARIAFLIQSTERREFKRLFIHLGDFHTEMSLTKGAGKFIDNCGLTDVLVESDLIGNSSLYSFLTGKSFNRCKRLHTLMSLGLQILEFEMFLDIKKITITESDIDYFNKLQESPLKDMAIDNFDVKQLLVDFKNFHEEVLSGVHGKTPQFYAIYIDLIKHFFMLERSIRLNDLDLYIYILKKICGFFFAVNHYNYAKWLAYYIDRLLKMEETHPGLRSKFLLGVKRTNKPFSRIAPDLTLEQTINAEAGRRMAGFTYITNSINS